MSQADPALQPSSARCIRKAGPGDLVAMLECDSYAQAHAEREQEVRIALEQGQGWVEMCNEQVTGYLLLRHDFFGQGFVSLVVVAPGQQRQGVALRLLGAAQQACRTARLFTSTNRSNQAAQRLFAKAGFQPSGVIENLDEGDPELIFCKAVG
ncbi:GNAT family N-acetyltransferase [Pseudomonas sp. NFXW11]|uniref:GNAT family N-acetyltransferase n=1 Tax=Pseudomonas sp. NFXW11 TaxID=2819531 RepID=UPI003CF4281C